MTTGLRRLVGCPSWVLAVKRSFEARIGYPHGRPGTTRRGVSWLSLTLVLLATVSSSGTQTASDDFLDAGIVFRGRVTFERGKTTTMFAVRTDDSFVLLRVQTARAFAPTPNTSMSYQLAQRLAQAQNISVRIADVRDVPGGTVGRSDSISDIVMCPSPSPAERNETDSFYTFQCIAFDEQRQIRNDTGNLRFPEIVIVVSVPSGSAAELFLSQTRKVIYVRLETT